MSTCTQWSVDSARRELELEYKLNQARDTIQEMRKRERELTDRYGGENNTHYTRAHHTGSVSLVSLALSRTAQLFKTLEWAKDRG